MDPLPPGSTIGILGGGQLGRMLALAAARLGLKTHVYSDESESCAFYVATETTRASFRDPEKLAEFARRCDAVTFEFENVPDETVRELMQHVPVAPGPEPLRIAQDRFLEKSFLQQQGLLTAPFRNVMSESEAREAFAGLGGQAVLKTRRLGYDGKGQRIVKSADDAARAFAELGDVPSILEGFVEFAFETSVIAARGRNGAFAAYDPALNEHEHHILRRSTVPAGLPENKVQEAFALARRIAEAVNYVGVLGVELFVTKTLGLLVNEIAPRVHNSGHWTIDGCAVSQFEQHIRAVAGWPLGNPERHSDAVMQNIIGAEAEDWRHLGERGGFHLYGKRVVRPGRKMGHFTTISPRK
ncbi:MAG TPA: 5-(carboxyamino)imidazole ribonucleotide synthase [Micropepsaceae bacterium]|nr:5-(carboxyamino)imidazole ribonucleotide synthase [Micropepsaceae bacterium]